MSGWAKSDQYPTWRKGRGIYTETVTGACDNGKYVREYNKIGSIFGINFVSKKDQYEEGLFGFVPLEEGADVGTWNFVGENSTNRERFDDCLNYAIERDNNLTDYDFFDEVSKGEGSSETEDKYRPPRVSTSLPIIPMVMGVVVLIAIIMFFRK